MRQALEPRVRPPRTPDRRVNLSRQNKLSRAGRQGKTLGIVAAVAVAARVGYVLAFMRGTCRTATPTATSRSRRRSPTGTATRSRCRSNTCTRLRSGRRSFRRCSPAVSGCSARTSGSRRRSTSRPAAPPQSSRCCSGAGSAGRAPDRCAGLVVALYPPLIANDVTVLVESIALLLLFAAVLLLLDGRTAWAGVALGLLMLDRAERAMASHRARPRRRSCGGSAGCTRSASSRLRCSSSHRG